MKGNPYGSLKIFHHHKVLKSLEEGEAFAPIYVRIKPTNFCNHNCFYCASQTSNLNHKDSFDGKNSIPWRLLEQFIHDISDMGVKAVTFSGGGEPLVYPRIRDAVALVKAKGMDLSLISNGQLLSGEIKNLFLDSQWVRISLDSPNKEEYCKIRNLPLHFFDEVCDNIAAFAREKSKDCQLGINYVVNDYNCSRVYEAVKFVKGLGVNNIKISAVINSANQGVPVYAEEVIEQIKKAKELQTESFAVISKYEQEVNPQQIKTRSLDHCYINQLITVLGADSKIYFCHQRAYDSDAVVGDISEKSFKELWFSDEVRQRFNCLNPKEECMNSCIYEERNVLLHNYLNTDKRHINFV